jgi:hypothetical protein
VWSPATPETRGSRTKSTTGLGGRKDISGDTEVVGALYEQFAKALGSYGYLKPWPKALIVPTYRSPIVKSVGVETAPRRSVSPGSLQLSTGAPQ